MIRLMIHILFVFFAALRTTIAVSSNAPQKPLKKTTWATGAQVPISCLDRAVETGEHISDEKGHLKYIPFLTCNETSLPLSIPYATDIDLNCTVPFITDPIFHLLEFYVHNDSPLACRMPARPLSASSPSSIAATTAETEEDEGKWIPLTFALTGTLQLSHLHVAHHLNIIVHDSPSSPGVLDSGIAYSVSPHALNTRIVIGDALPLVLSVRWFAGPNLPRGWRGVGGHLTGSTVLYCLISALAGAAVSVAWFRGYELPRRLRRYGIDRLGGGEGGGGRGYGHSGGYGGYGYGVGGNGNGVGAYGKRD